MKFSKVLNAIVYFVVLVYRIKDCNPLLMSMNGAGVRFWNDLIAISITLKHK